MTSLQKPINLEIAIALRKSAKRDHLMQEHARDVTIEKICLESIIVCNSNHLQ